MKRCDLFNRTALLTGTAKLDEFATRNIIIFGVGGVGSWTAETLVRTGYTNITLVDADCVAVSNINRQLPATSLTVGEVKVDAIDSLTDKALLILKATEATAATASSARPVKFYSSMGAALKLDPSRISVAEFWKVKGCPLAAALRRKFKKSGQFPNKKFQCVFSDELVQNHPDAAMLTDTSGALSYHKASTNGSLMHITAIFGITLASLIIRDTLKF